MPEVPDRSIRICADRGGTFCDVHASYPDPDTPGERKEIVVKLRMRPIHCLLYLYNLTQHSVSQDEANYKDAPTEGIRRVLEIATGKQIERTSVLQTDKIGTRRYSLALSIYHSIYCRLHQTFHHCRDKRLT